MEILQYLAPLLTLVAGWIGNIVWIRHRKRKAVSEQALEEFKGVREMSEDYATSIKKFADTITTLELKQIELTNELKKAQNIIKEKDYRINNLEKLLNEKG